MMSAAAVAVASLAFTTGCVRIDGGAVEVSWAVRTPDGRAIKDCSCAVPAISRVRLQLRGVNGSVAGATPCDGRAQCEFPCQRQTGSTPFDIKETQPGETYEISLAALDAEGTKLDGVAATAPILRTVERGQPTEVEAFLLVAPSRCGN